MRATDRSYPGLRQAGVLTSVHAFHRRAVLMPILTVMCTFSVGCQPTLMMLYNPGYQETCVLDSPFREDQVAAIRPGASTRTELVQRFGPPRVVSRPGVITSVPAPGRGRSWQDLESGMVCAQIAAHLKDVYPMSLERVSAEHYLGRFPMAASLASEPLVYYYERVEMKGRYDVPQTTQGLWVLIDESTAKVVAVRLETAEEPVRKARDAPATPISWRVKVLLP